MAFQRSQQSHPQLSQDPVWTKPFSLQSKPVDTPTLSEIAERASRFSYNFTPVPIHTSKTQVPLRIQPKLMIGQPDDHQEQEADQIAQQVTQRLQQPKLRSPVPHGQTPLDTLRLKPLAPTGRSQNAGITVPPSLETSIQQARSKGQPLPSQVRQSMEQSLGADLSQVKIHTDAQADRFNRVIQSHAFTTGRDIFFRRTAYAPHSQTGQRLIAHELTHVLQQQGSSSSVIQRLIDPKTELEVDVTQLSLKEIEDWLERSDITESDRVELTEQKARREVEEGSSVRKVTRRKTAQNKAVKLKKKSEEERKQRIGLKAATKKLSAEERQAKLDKALEEAAEKSKMAMRRSQAKQVAASVLKSEEMDLDSEDLGHTFTGQEVPKGHSFSGIHKTIEGLVNADLSKPIEQPDVPSYVKDVAVKTSNSKKDIDFMQDTEGRTILAWGRISPSNIPFKKETPEAQGRLEFDDRGHLVPEAGVKDPDIANKTQNIIAENAIINQQYKKAWEDAVKAFAEQNPKSNVWSIHEPLYTGKEVRPHAIRHYVVLDNTIVSVFTFKNPVKIEAHNFRI